MGEIPQFLMVALGEMGVSVGARLIDGRADLAPASCLECRRPVLVLRASAPAVGFDVATEIGSVQYLRVHRCDVERLIRSYRAAPGSGPCLVRDSPLQGRSMTRIAPPRPGW